MERGQQQHELSLRAYLENDRHLNQVLVPSILQSAYDWLVANANKSVRDWLAIYHTSEMNRGKA